MLGKLERGFPLDIVSRYRNAIYGLSIFWIVLFHAHAIDKVRFLFHEPGFYWLGRLISLGNVGVDVFLFLSGISLYYSFHKNPDVKRFYKRRFFRVFPAVWLIFGVYWAIKYLFLNFEPLNFLGRMTAMRFWVTGDESIWFVSLILLLYLAYPLIYKWLFHWQKGLVLRAVIAIACAVAVALLVREFCPDYYKKVSIALTRVPVFLFGCAMGKPVFEKRRVSWIVPLLLVAGVALFFAEGQLKMLSGTWRRFFWGFGGVCLAYFFAMFFAACARATKNEQLGLIRFFSWLGGFSLELYLSHIMLNQALRLNSFYIKGDAVQYLAMATLAVAVAWFARWLITTVGRHRANRLASAGS